MQKLIAVLAVVWTLLLGIIALELYRIAELAGTFVFESNGSTESTETDAKWRTTQKPAIDQGVADFK